MTPDPAGQPPIRALVVDDTVIYRKAVSDALSELPGVEVVGVAGNGKIALAKIGRLKPDLITLDIEMPVMTGIEVLGHLRTMGSTVGVLVLSTLTREGGALTLRAMELGAFDFVPKPQSGSAADNHAYLKRELAAKISAFAGGRGAERATPSTHRAGTSDARRAAAPGKRVKSRERPEVVGIGVSTGGPNALATLLSALPADLPAGVLVVQHMPPLFTESLAASLDRKCAIAVREARDGETVAPGQVLLAPGGRHMKVAAAADGLGRIVRISDDPPVNNCKPAVDVLFESLARHYAGRASGVLLTGMGSDGVSGMRTMHQVGCHLIAQDEASCVVFGMPRGAIEAGVVDVVAPLDQIAAEICHALRTRAAAGAGAPP